MRADLPDHGLLYVKNPKAACSTLLFWLDLLHTGDDTFAPHSVHKEHRLPQVKDVGWDTVARMLAGDAFRFSFVRDPIGRVESAYRDKIMSVQNDRWRILVQETLGMPVDPKRALTFDQFDELAPRIAAVAQAVGRSLPVAADMAAVSA